MKYKEGDIVEVLCFREGADNIGKVIEICEDAQLPYIVRGIAGGDTWGFNFAEDELAPHINHLLDWLEK